MSRLMDLLDQCETFWLATADGDQPKLRPIGAHVEVDGRVTFLIGSHKGMCRQLHENPNCEIGGFTGRGQWLRLTGRAVFDDNPQLVADFLATHKGLRRLYNDETGHTLVPFHLEDAEAHRYAMGHVVEDVKA